VHHQDELRHVIGKLCQTAEGRAYIALNAVTPDGLQPVGHGNAVNQVRGMEVNFDTLVFKLKGEEDKRVVPLQHPERLSHTVHASLGFTEAWRPPVLKTEEPKPENKPRPQNTMRPG
jgi:putative DNA primase/helicase